MRSPSASWWGGRSLPPALLLLALSSTACVLAAPARLLADKPDCFKQVGSEVVFELVDECKKASATLSFPGEKLTFGIEYGGGDVYTSGNFTVGGCPGTFMVSQDLSHPPRRFLFALSYNDETQARPFKGQASASNVKIGNKASNCLQPPKLEDAGDGKKKSTVSFDMSSAAPSLVFKLAATLEKEEKSGDASAGTFSGWKLWLLIGGAALLLLIALAAAGIAVVCCRLRKRKAAQKKPSAKSRRHASKKAARSSRKAQPKEGTSDPTPVPSGENLKPPEAESKVVIHGPAATVATRALKDEPRGERTARELTAAEQEALDAKQDIVIRAKEMGFSWPKDLALLHKGKKGMQETKLPFIFRSLYRKEDMSLGATSAFLRRYPLEGRLLAEVRAERDQCERQREDEDARFSETAEWRWISEILTHLLDHWQQMEDARKGVCRPIPKPETQAQKDEKHWVVRRARMLGFNWRKELDAVESGTIEMRQMRLHSIFKFLGEDLKDEENTDAFFRCYPMDADTLERAKRAAIKAGQKHATMQVEASNLAHLERKEDWKFIHEVLVHLVDRWEKMEAAKQGAKQGAKPKAKESA